MPRSCFLAKRHEHQTPPAGRSAHERKTQRFTVSIPKIHIAPRSPAGSRPPQPRAQRRPRGSPHPGVGHTEPLRPSRSAQRAATRPGPAPTSCSFKAAKNLAFSEMFFSRFLSYADSCGLPSCSENGPVVRAAGNGEGGGGLGAPFAARPGVPHPPVPTPSRRCRRRRPTRRPRAPGRRAPRAAASRPPPPPHRRRPTAASGAAAGPAREAASAARGAAGSGAGPAAGPGGSRRGAVVCAPGGGMGRDAVVSGEGSRAEPRGAEPSRPTSRSNLHLLLGARRQLPALRRSRPALRRHQHGAPGGADPALPASRSGSAPPTAPSARRGGARRRNAASSGGSRAVIRACSCVAGPGRLEGRRDPRPAPTRNSLSRVLALPARPEALASPRAPILAPVCFSAEDRRRSKRASGCIKSIGALPGSLLSVSCWDRPLQQTVSRAAVPRLLRRSTARGESRAVRKAWNAPGCWCRPEARSKPAANSEPERSALTAAWGARQQLFQPQHWGEKLKLRTAKPCFIHQVNTPRGR